MASTTVYHGTGPLQEVPGIGAILGVGGNLPTGPGYAPGAEFIKTGENAGRYVNDGDGESAVFIAAIHQLSADARFVPRNAHQVAPVQTVRLSDYTDLDAAKVAIGRITRTLLVIDEATTLGVDSAGDVEFPQTVDVEVSAAGSIDHGAFTLTTNGKFTCRDGGLTNSSTGDFVFNGADKIDARWWSNTPQVYKILYARDSAALSDCKVVYLSGAWTVTDEAEADFNAGMAAIPLNSASHSNITFRGDELVDGEYPTKLTFSEQTAHVGAMFGLDGEANELRNISFENLWIDMGSAPNDHGISNSSPELAGQAAPQTNGIYDCKIKRCKATGGTTGFDLSGGNWICEDLETYNGSAKGINAGAGTQHFKRIICKYSGGTGFDLKPSEGDWRTYVTIEDFTIDHHLAAGLKWGDVLDSNNETAAYGVVRLVNGTLNKNGTHGLHATITGSGTLSNVHTHCTNIDASHNASAGFNAGYSHYVMTNCSATFNRGTSTAGFQRQDNMQSVAFVGGDYSSNAGGGIHVFTGDVTSASGVTVQGNGNDGMQYRGTTGGSDPWSDCTLSDNVGDDIDVFSSTGTAATFDACALGDLRVRTGATVILTNGCTFDDESGGGTIDTAGN